MHYHPVRISSVAAVFLTAASLSAQIFEEAPRHRLSKELSEIRQGHVKSSESLRVIVQWKIERGEKTRAKIDQLGGTVINEYKFVPVGAYEIPSRSLEQLENDPDVAYVTPDRKIHHKLDYSGAAVNAIAARGAGVVGTGIGVVVIDSGINADPNLAVSTLSLDFTGAQGSDFGMDDFGHGQHVAGIIAGTSATTTSASGYTRNFYGIAPGVSLLNFRVLDANGEGTDIQVIEAINAAIGLRQNFNIKVINLSLGRPVTESYTLDPLCLAVEAAWKSGITVVVAAGNDGRDNSFTNGGYGTITAPGNDPYVITVGAMKTMSTYTRTDDLIASYSSKGPTQVDHIVKPDIVAPGNRVVSLLASNSTLSQEYPGNDVLLSYYEASAPTTQISKNFFTLSGTSMAAPVVSGAAADLLQVNPLLTPDQIKALLMQTAYKTFPVSSSVTDPTTGNTYTSYYDIFTVGAGYLDLQAALAAISTVPANASALSPTASVVASALPAPPAPAAPVATPAVPAAVATPAAPALAAAPALPLAGPAAPALAAAPAGSIILTFANSSIFSTQSIWGAQAVWGNSVLNGNQAVWGSKAVWGANTPQAEKAVWGSQSIWGASTTTGAETDILNINGEN